MFQKILKDFFISSGQNLFFDIYFYLEIFTMSKNNIISCQSCPGTRGDPRPWKLRNWPLLLHHEAMHCLVYVSKFPVPTIPSSKCTILPFQNWKNILILIILKKGIEIEKMHFFNKLFESHWCKHALDFWNYEV